jgi:hypothetical protein
VAQWVVSPLALVVASQRVWGAASRRALEAVNRRESAVLVAQWVASPLALVVASQRVWGAASRRGSAG